MLVYTGTILALDWSLPSSSPATHRVELPEENVILGMGEFGTGVGVGAKEGIIDV